MKRLRLTARLDGEGIPEFFDRLTNDPTLEEARLRDWNLTADKGLLLFDVEGDVDSFAAAARELAGVERVETTADGDGGRALLTIRPSVVPIVSCLADALEDGGLMVRKPVVFGEGAIQVRVIGDPEPLQVALERRGGAVDVRIAEISPGPAGRNEHATDLSDRQREVLSTAVAMGYYEQPRDATHADIAAELGCAPQTVSDHLQKAEAKLAAGAVDAFGDDA